MAPETSKFNPGERVPFGAKKPDTPEFNAAMAQMDAEKTADEAERQRQADLNKAIYLSPEKAAAMRAQWEEEIRKKREEIKKMN